MRTKDLPVADSPAVFISPRLVLRPVKLSEAADLYALSQNVGFLSFQISNYKRSSIEDSEQWISRQDSYHRRNKIGIFGIFEKVENRLNGLAALKYLGEERKSPIELMYRLSDAAWGFGYATEAATLLVRHAFDDLSLEKLVATVDPKNMGSKKVLQKLGFAFSTVITVQSFKEELYELKKEEWLKAAKARSTGEMR